MASSGGRWPATIASVWIQCIAGSSYTFGIYSVLLKSTQHYNQSTLDTVSVFKDIGANAGILSGLLYSALSSADCGGPWVVIAAGALQSFVGYFFIWSAVVGLFPPPPLPLMCFFIFLAAHAQTFFNTASVVTGVWNFPAYSGTIVGIMKGFLGLSGPILVQLYQTFCGGDPAAFLLVLALLPPAVSAPLMFSVRLDPSESRDDKRRLDALSLAALGVASYLTLLISLGASLPRPAALLSFSLLLLLLVFPPLRLSASARRDALGGSHPPLLGKTEPGLRREGASLAEAARTPDFWLLCAAAGCGMGSGLATINNISQIGESLGYPSRRIATLVSLWGVWNFLGRLGSGYCSDALLRRSGLPRPLCMAAALVAMGGGHLAVALGFPGNLYLGLVVVGVCYGSLWSLMPTVCSEVFGPRNVGAVFNAVAAASPVGSYVLSVLVVGRLYDREASGPDGACSGARCFMLSFAVLAAVCLLGFAAAAALVLRTRGFYRRLVAEGRNAVE